MFSRTRSRELMDQPDVDAAELARSLVDLERVNRWLGGTRVVLDAIGPMLRGLRGREVRVLDVATGSADIPLALAHWGRRESLRLDIVATDGHLRTVEVARCRADREPNVSVELADALALPYPDDAFDFAMCHTALHHFDAPDAVRVLRELDRVASRAVVVTDLMRSRVGLLGVRLLASTVWRNHPITRHDGVISIQAAFTPSELTALAAEAGLGAVRVQSYFFFNRMALVGGRAAGGAMRP